MYYQCEIDQPYLFKLTELSNWQWELLDLSQIYVQITDDPIELNVTLCVNSYVQSLKGLNRLVVGSWREWGRRCLS